MRRGDFAAAVSTFEEALPLVREEGDRRGEGMTLDMIGVGLRELGRPADALARHEQARPILEEVGDRGGVATVDRNIGDALQRLGRTRDAIGFFQRAYHEYEAVGEQAGMREADALIAPLAYPSPAVVEHLERGRGLQTHADPPGVYRRPEDLRALHEDRLRAALPAYESAVARARADGDRPGEAAALNMSAHVLAGLNRLPEALARNRDAGTISEEIGNHDAVAASLYNQADIVARLGRNAEAIELYQRSRDACLAVADNRGAAKAEAKLAELASAAPGGASSGGERIEGPTPAGGAYAEVLRDESGRVLEIVEYAADGRVINRTYAARS
jgi:tetratricopeptide (TPR) repeat protein